MCVIIMNKILVLGFVCLMVASSISAYTCIYPEVDNDAVIEFKSNMNMRALENDIENGLTKDVIGLKLEYFGPCNN